MQARPAFFIWWTATQIHCSSGVKSLTNHELEVAYPARVYLAAAAHAFETS